MLKPELLPDLLHSERRATKDRLLLVLAVDIARPKTLQDIRDLAVNAGWRAVRSVDVSKVLGRTKGLAIRTPKGWELTTSGRQYLVPLVQPTSPVLVISQSLRDHLPSIMSADARAFADEAVKCYEARLYRAAVVLSWVGAVAVLHDHVVKNHLPEFNAEATRRDAKWRAAKDADGVGRMGEHDFLDVLAALSIIGKNVKDELQKALKLRNGCGHPNSLRVSEHQAAAHIELLIDNVFANLAFQ